MLHEKTRKKIIAVQKNEITEHIVYKKLSQSMKNEKNRRIVERISSDELKHYNFWKKYTGEDVQPSSLKVWWYVSISKILGITFGLKLMEKGEEGAQKTYGEISKAIPHAKKIEKEENVHEQKLLGMLDEERLKYMGSVVLGLNDALVELTGALAGFTFALQQTRLIALVGLITGIAASFSMAASEYLSTKSEGGIKSPIKASVYTFIAYLLTVLLLTLPFFMLSDMYAALGLTIAFAVMVIFAFTFYISVAKDLPFRKRFLEMLVISLGVAGLSFLIGAVIKITLGV